MINRIKNYLRTKEPVLDRNQRIQKYLETGKEPWSVGYEEFKEDSIKSAITSESLIAGIRNKTLPSGFGKRIDERIVEYPWIFSKLNNSSNRLLDAGSTFNFKFIVEHSLVAKKELTIFTYNPEANIFNRNRISYVYGDLRDMPFKNDRFNETVCHSTIEHIDMDNSIYGYDIENSATSGKKSYEYLKAVEELIRVTASTGTVLLTFPYGTFENHGFFQQLDREMTGRIVHLFAAKGKIELDFFRYYEDGWRFVSQDECSDAQSFNPHTGKGKLTDGAAHCRGICCISFTKA